MNGGSTSQEIKRLRIALVLLLIGAVFIIWAWTSWMYRSANIVATQTLLRTEPIEPDPKNMLAARGLGLLLFVGLLLVLLVLFGGYAIVRAGRKHRERLLRPAPPPSAIDDIWSKHQPRSIDLEDDEGTP